MRRRCPKSRREMQQQQQRRAIVACGGGPTLALSLPPPACPSACPPPLSLPPRPSQLQSLPLPSFGSGGSGEGGGERKGERGQWRKRDPGGDNDDAGDRPGRLILLSRNRVLSPAIVPVRRCAQRRLCLGCCFSRSLARTFVVATLLEPVKISFSAAAASKQASSDTQSVSSVSPSCYTRQCVS